jgi:hypothetical protein
MTHAEHGMTDRPTDNPTDPPTVWSATRSTGRWLTFAQAGAELGLSAEATRSRARRAGWRTMPGNDGRTLVMIPDDLAIHTRPAGRPPERPTGERVATARPTGALTAAVSSLEGALATLTEQLTRERDRADQAVDRADRIEKERDAKRVRADALADQAHVIQAKLATAEVAAEQARRDAQAARIRPSSWGRPMPRDGRGTSWRGSEPRGGGE